MGSLFSGNLQYLWNGARQDKGYYWWPTENRIRAFDWCQNKRPWITFTGHYALCFKTRASFRARHENLNEDRLYYQRRRCSPMTRFWQYVVYGDIRSGSQDLCKFSLEISLRDASLYYVYRKRHAVVVFNFKCLFMTISYQYGCRGCWSAWLAEMWEAE